MLLAFYLLAQNPAGDYAIIDYRLHHGHLPLGSVAVVVLASWPVWLVLIAILLWVFPDGRLPQGRWRRVAVVLAAAGALLAVAATAGGAAAVAGHTVRVNASGNLVSNTTGAAGLAQGAVALGVLASLLIWLAVQVPRYRRLAGERRQQFKWLVHRRRYLRGLGDQRGAGLGRGPRAWIWLSTMPSPRGFRGPPSMRGRRGAEVPAVRRSTALSAGSSPTSSSPSGWPGCSPGSCCWPPRCCRSRRRWRWRPPRWPPRRCSTRSSPGPAGGRPPVQPGPVKRRPDRGRIRVRAEGRRGSRLGPGGPGRCRAESPGARPHLHVDERTRRTWLSRPVAPGRPGDDDWRRSRVGGPAGWGFSQDGCRWRGA